MKRYESYKDSGQQWLGEVPSLWDIKRLGSHFSERKVKVSDKDFEPLSVTKLGVFPQWENVAKTNDGDNRKLVRNGDFVINSRSDRKGSSGVADRDGSVSLINIVLRPRKSIRAQFSQYLLKSYSFIEEFYRNGHGIVADLWTTRFDEMKMIKLAMPPLAEQDAIVSYLDTATADIDKAIEQQQRMINLLNERKQIIIQNAVTKGIAPNVEFKDSGIDVVGQIPSEWVITKLKRKVTLHGRIGFRGYTNADLVSEGEGAITLSPSNMVSGKMDYHKCSYLSWAKYYESPEIMVYNNDILFVKTGSTYGKSSLVENLPMETTINPQILLMKEHDIHMPFLAYLLQTQVIQKQVEYSVIGSTIPTISQFAIGNITFACPPRQEQIQIAEYLNSVVGSLNEPIQKCNQIIQKLQERKRIVINDVVTGKMKVS